MDFRQLKYLVALAQVKHFAHAAEVCHVTQPTLSSRIRQLEEEFGVPLVIRDHRFRGLTSYGQRVVDWSIEVLGTYEEIKEEFAHLQQAGGRISVGIEPSAAPLMALLISYLNHKGVEVGIDFKTLDSKTIYKQITHNSLELGILYKDLNDTESAPENNDVPICYELCQETYVAVSCEENGVRVPAPVSWRDLRQYPLCTPSSSVPAYDVIAPSLGTEEEPILPAMETDCWLTMFQAVRRNGMVGIAPRHLLGMLAIPPKTYIEPLPVPANPLTLCMVARLPSEIEPALKRVIDVVGDFKDYFLSQSDELRPGVVEAQAAV